MRGLGLALVSYAQNHIFFKANISTFQHLALQTLKNCFPLNVIFTNPFICICFKLLRHFLYSAQSRDLRRPSGDVS